MNCNTNNCTERLNLDLKYVEFDGYKNCILSKLLTIIIEEFIPKLYRNYVTVNVRFTSEHKKYLEKMPSFVKDRPRALVTDILDKKYPGLQMKSDPQLKKVLTILSG